MSRLNVEPLEKAVSQLAKGLDQMAGAEGDDLKRDGVIQRFEYTVDLCWKLLQRYLKDVAEIDDASIRSKKDLFREAARLRLIGDAESWIGHYEARNETSHTYNTVSAEAVYARARPLLADARALLENLRRGA